MKLDESFEIKNSEEQNILIDSFESEEENKIAEDKISHNLNNEDIPNGVSIESASYIENNAEAKINNQASQAGELINNTEEEHTPLLFSEEQHQETTQTEKLDIDNDTQQLFDQDTNEDEDFEIPAFLRRQKF